MDEETHDAMTYVKKYGGAPDLFIAFMCNPQWSEIANNRLPNQQFHDHYDIVSRSLQILGAEADVRHQAAQCNSSVAL